jgi:hypothetical protein
VKKIILFLLLCTLALAEQFSGRIIDTVGQPWPSVELTINGQKTAVDAQGYYRLETPAAVSGNYYFLKIGERNYLFVARNAHLNLQLAAENESASRSEVEPANLYFTILDNGQSVEKADVTLYMVDAKTGRSSAWLMLLRDYERGQVVYQGVPPLRALYLTVSRNSALYTQRVANVLPGQSKEIEIDLARFQPADGSSGVGYRDAERYWQMLPLPTANSYYVGDRTMPATARELAEYKLLYFGPEPRFPENLDYYNLKELTCAADYGQLTVYTDLPLADLDLSGYGDPQIIFSKGYRVNNTGFANFSLSGLQRSREVFFWQRPRSVVTEEDDD